MDSLTRCGLAAFALVCPIVSGVSGAADPGVIVTATRFPERELEVPVGVTVIHADAIAAHTARTLPELLAQVAGITTRDAAPPNSPLTSPKHAAPGTNTSSPSLKFVLRPACATRPTDS